MSALGNSENSANDRNGAHGCPTAAIDLGMAVLAALLLVSERPKMDATDGQAWDPVDKQHRWRCGLSIRRQGFRNRTAPKLARYQAGMS